MENSKFAGLLRIVIQFGRGTEPNAMPQTVTIRGRYENRTFIPSEPMPGVEGEAELIVTPKVNTSQSPVFFRPPPKLTSEEFQKRLDELVLDPPGRVLPADFSREDIYDDDDL